MSLLGPLNRFHFNGLIQAGFALGNFGSLLLDGTEILERKVLRDHKHFCILGSHCIAIATSDLSVWAVSWIAKKVFSETLLNSLGNNPSSLDLGNFRCTVGLVGVALAFPVIKYYWSVFNNDTYTLETRASARFMIKKNLLIAVFGSPVILHLTNCLAQSLIRR